MFHKICCCKSSQICWNGLLCKTHLNDPEYSFHKSTYYSVVVVFSLQGCLCGRIIPGLAPVAYCITISHDLMTSLPGSLWRREHWQLHALCSFSCGGSPSGGIPKEKERDANPPAPILWGKVRSDCFGVLETEPGMKLPASPSRRGRNFPEHDGRGALHYFLQLSRSVPGAPPTMVPREPALSHHTQDMLLA